jgi:uncharacterized membrane protein required for colicin V production
MNWPFTELPPPSMVDACAGGVILLAALQGLFRGLSKEWPRLLNMCVSLAVALFGHHRFMLFLLTHSRLEEPAARAAAFAGLLVAAMLTLFVARLLLKLLVKAQFEFKGERGAGLLAGGASAALLVFAVFYAMNLWPAPAVRHRFGSGSLVGSMLVRFLPELNSPAGAPPAYDAAPPEPAPAAPELDGTAPADDLAR